MTHSPEGDRALVLDSSLSQEPEFIPPQIMSPETHTSFGEQWLAEKTPEELATIESERKGLERELAIVRENIEREKLAASLRNIS